MLKLVFAWVRFAFTLPWSLTAWLLGLLSMLVFATKIPRFEGAGILTVQLRSWLSRRWGYSTTIGRVIFWGDGFRTLKDDDPDTEANERVESELDERHERHERTHIWQIEDLMLLSFLVGLVTAIHTGDWGFGFFLWWSGGFWQVPNFLMAFLRFGHTVSWPQGDAKTWDKFKAFAKNVYEVIYRDSLHERGAYGTTDRWPNGESWAHTRAEARSAATGNAVEDPM